MMVFIPLLPFRFALHRSTWTSFSLHTGIAVLIHVEMRRIEGCLTMMHVDVYIRRIENLGVSATWTHLRLWN